MKNSAFLASDNGFCSEAPGRAAGRNPVNYCGADRGRAGKTEFAETPTGASNGDQPQPA